MKRHLFIGVLAMGFLALSVFIGGCGSTGAGKGVPKRGQVTISMAFPGQQSVGNNVAPAGVPMGADEAKVKIKDASDQVILQVTLTPSQPQRTVTVPVGVQLTFETSVFDNDPPNGGSAVEIAWGSLTQLVHDGDVVTLSARGIASSLYVSGPHTIYIGKKATFSVMVIAPNGFPVGPGDYTFTCTVPSGGATCTTGPTSFTIVADGTQTSVTVSVEVSALKPDHTEGTLNTQLTLTVEDPSAAADIAIEKTVDNSSPNVNDVVTFTVMARNIGPVNISNVKVNDVLPSGLQYQSSNASVGTYDPNTGVWDIGVLNTGTDATLTITVKVTQSGTLTNTATLDTSQLSPADTNDSNNSASVSVFVGQTTGSVSIGGDAAPPDCHFEKPQWGDSLVVNQPVDIRVNGFDSSDAVQNLTVTVYLGSDVVGTLSYDPNNYVFEGTWTPTAEFWGEQYLVGIIEDPQGNTGTCFTRVLIH